MSFITTESFSEFDPHSREARLARAYFAAVTRKMARFHDGCFVVVTHVLEDRPAFFEALSELAQIAAINPKPSSIHTPTLEAVTKRWPVVHIDRGEMAKPSSIELLAKHIKERPFIALDIGGYFAASGTMFKQRFGAKFRGVVEGTKNGSKRHRKFGPVVPVVDISGSNIKRSEAFPVARSVFYSAEAILREAGETYAGKAVLVIGYGDVGEALAQRLQDEGLHVFVTDTDPLKILLARSRGFATPPREIALVTADLIFCATGNQALVGRDFGMMKNGAYVFCITSSDDELDAAALESFHREKISTSITAYQSARGCFFLAHDGRAVNFLHGAEVRPFIRAVQAAFLAGVNLLIQNDDPTARILHLDQLVEQEITRIFLEHYGS